MAARLFDVFQPWHLAMVGIEASSTRTHSWSGHYWALRSEHGLQDGVYAGGCTGVDEKHGPYAAVVVVVWGNLPGCRVGGAGKVVVFWNDCCGVDVSSGQLLGKRRRGQER